MSEPFECSKCKKKTMYYLWSFPCDGVKIATVAKCKNCINTMLTWEIVTTESKHKKMWENLTKELEKREMSGKPYGITFILHLMQAIKEEYNK